MGQKVNAHGNRVGIIKDWDTKWYADKKNFATNLKQDDDIRKFIKKNYYKSAISKITIERAANKVTVNITPVVPQPSSASRAQASRQ